MSAGLYSPRGVEVAYEWTMNRSCDQGVMCEIDWLAVLYIYQAIRLHLYRYLLPPRTSRVFPDVVFIVWNKQTRKHMCSLVIQQLAFPFTCHVIFHKRLFSILSSVKKQWLQCFSLSCKANDQAGSWYNCHVRIDILKYRGVIYVTLTCILLGTQIWGGCKVKTCVYQLHSWSCTV